MGHFFWQRNDISLISPKLLTQRWDERCLKKTKNWQLLSRMDFWSKYSGVNHLLIKMDGRKRNRNVYCMKQYTCNFG